MLKSLTLALMVSLVAFYGFGPMSILGKVDTQAQFCTEYTPSQTATDKDASTDNDKLQP